MAYRDEVLADSPIEYWEFDEESGALAQSTGSGDHDANHNGNPLVVQGRIGRARWYDGVDDTTVAQNVGEFRNGPFTVECWVRYDGTYTSDYPTFVRRGGPGDSQFLVRTRGPAAGSRVHAIETYFDGRTTDTSTLAFNDDQWHHVVATRSGTTLRLWVDGVLYTNGTGSVSAKTPISSAPTNIGRGQGESEYFKGYLDEVAIYDKVLSDARIAAHFAAATAGPPMDVLSGETNVLALGSLQGPTIALGAVQTPPMEVLAGMAEALSLNTLLGPTIVKGVAVVPPKSIRTGVAGTLTLRELAASITLTEPEPIELLGEWFFEVLMSQKAFNALNPTASLEVRNARKHMRPELKTLVRA